MALVLRRLATGYQHVFVELADQRFNDYPLMGSPLWIVMIISGYVYLVKTLGPRLMRDRPAFHLDRVIQVYDVIQIMLSTYTFERTLSLAWFNGYNLQCEPVDYSTSPDALRIGNLAYVFFLMKILDMMDTVFIVMRKRDAQLSFLHVYHHAMTAGALWAAVKYYAGGHHTMVGTLNSAVHAVMYSYYLLTSIYPEQKANLWWKKYITQMQMVQFLLVIIHHAQMVALPGCGYPKLISISVILPQNFFMLAMFADFYRKAYLRPKPKQSQ